MGPADAGDYGVSPLPAADRRRATLYQRTGRVLFWASLLRSLRMRSESISWANLSILNPVIDSFYRFVSRFLSRVKYLILCWLVMNLCVFLLIKLLYQSISILEFAAPQPPPPLNDTTIIYYHCCLTQSIRELPANC